jgi:hypothetical protein
MDYSETGISICLHGAGPNIFMPGQSCFLPPAATRILQDLKAPGLLADQELLLAQWEPSTVQTYLALHGLPPSDAAPIYQYGGVDLRNEIRGFMRGALLGIITKKAEFRTDIEAAVYRWLFLRYRHKRSLITPRPTTTISVGRRIPATLRSTQIFKPHKA